MTQGTWRLIRHFKPDENWGDSERMVYEYVHELDLWRDFTGIPLLISTGTQGKHAKGSLHYQGRASDKVPAFGDRTTVFELFLAATRFGFTGVGIYPHWKRAGVVVGGIHTEMAGVDTPDASHRKKYWMGIPELDANGNEKRIAISIASLSKWGFLGPEKHQG